MKKNSFINGALIATLGIVITKVLGILYVIPFYAIVGETSIALYGYAYTIYNLFLSFSTVGIPPAMSKLISEYNAKDYYHTKQRAYKIGRNLLTILGVVLFVVMFSFAPSIAELIIGDNTGGNSIKDIAFVIRIISTAIIVVPHLSVTKGYLEGHKYMKEPAIGQVLEQVIRIIVILLGSYLCIKVLNLGTTKAIGVSVFGATVGGVVALLYLIYKIRKHKKDLMVNEKQKEEEKKITNKEIAKKLLIYAIPFISFGLALSIYDFIDATTIVKVLAKIGYKTKDAESILGVINTTGNKLNSVVLAISTGLITSLVPNITSSFVKKDIEDVRKKIKQAFLVLLYVTLPMTLGLSFLAEPVFKSFYGYSTWGPKVFCFTIFVALFRCIFTTSVSIAQSLNKFKNVFISIIAGIIMKLILQIPLIYLFNSLNLMPFWGSTLATLIGLFVSFSINIIVINKTTDFSFKAFIKSAIKFIYPLIIMIILLILLKKIIPINNLSRFNSIFIVVIYAFVGAVIYFSFTIKNGVFNEMFEGKFKKIKK